MTTPTRRPYLFTIRPNNWPVIVYATSQAEAETIMRNKYGHRAEYRHEAKTMADLLSAKEIINDD